MVAAESTMCSVFAQEQKKKNDGIVDTVANYTVMPVLDGARDLYEFCAGDQSPLIEPTDKDVKTIVLGFENTLLHASWTRNGAWSFRKRPHVQHFLQKLQSAGFEVIIFCDGNKFDWKECVAEFDPMRVASQYFYRDEQNFYAGKHIKDIRRLNRDLKNIIVIDAGYEESASQNPENALKIRPFEDDLDDHELYKLAILLDKINEFKIYDVRPIIRAYNENPNVNPFHKYENMKKQAERLLEEIDATEA